HVSATAIRRDHHAARRAHGDGGGGRVGLGIYHGDPTHRSVCTRRVQGHVRASAVRCYRNPPRLHIDRNGGQDLIGQRQLPLPCSTVRGILSRVGMTSSRVGRGPRPTRTSGFRRSKISVHKPASSPRWFAPREWESRRSVPSSHCPLARLGSSSASTASRNSGVIPSTDN